ncbi:hypothetical protein Tco_0045704 [Tanacetum coccineum]
MKETSCELLEDDQKKKIGKNNEAKITFYNALLRKEYEGVIMCKCAKEVCHTLIVTHQGNSLVNNYKINLLTQEYEKFSIFNKETINSGFTRFNAIVTTKVMTIKKAKDLATLPLDELIGNLKVYEMVLDNDGVDTKTSKEKGNRCRRDNRSVNGANRFGKGRENSFDNKCGESLKPKGTCYNCGIEGVRNTKSIGHFQYS